MAIEKINFHFPQNYQTLNFGDGAVTPMELSAITSAKVDECVDAVNGVGQSAIEARAIVDDMKVAQDNFITENNDTKAQLLVDNQALLDSLTASNTTFQNNVNADKTQYETDMNTALTNYKSSMDTSKATYETATNNALTTFQNDINASKTTYETNATNALESYKTDLNVSKTAFETTVNTEKQTFIDTANQTITDMQTQADNINASVPTVVHDELTTMINDGSLSNVINNELLGNINKTVSYIADLCVYVKKYNPVADGATHPLSERYATLTSAQVDYPCATALTDEIDWCAIQSAIDELQGNFSSQASTSCIKRLEFEAKTYVINKPLTNNDYININGNNAVIIGRADFERTGYALKLDKPDNNDGYPYPKGSVIYINQITFQYFPQGLYFDNNNAGDSSLIKLDNVYLNFIGQVFNQDFDTAENWNADSAIGTALYINCQSTVFQIDNCKFYLAHRLIYSKACDKIVVKNSWLEQWYSKCGSVDGTIGNYYSNIKYAPIVLNYGHLFMENVILEKMNHNKIFEQYSMPNGDVHLMTARYALNAWINLIIGAVICKDVRFGGEHFGNTIINYMMPYNENYLDAEVYFENCNLVSQLGEPNIRLFEMPQRLAIKNCSYVGTPYDTMVYGGVTYDFYAKVIDWSISMLQADIDAKVNAKYYLLGGTFIELKNNNYLFNRFKQVNDIASNLRVFLNRDTKKNDYFYLKDWQNYTYQTQKLQFDSTDKFGLGITGKYAYVEFNVKLALEYNLTQDVAINQDMLNFPFLLHVTTQVENNAVNGRGTWYRKGLYTSILAITMVNYANYDIVENNLINTCASAVADPTQNTVIIAFKGSKSKSIAIGDTEENKKIIVALQPTSSLDTSLFTKNSEFAILQPLVSMFPYYVPQYDDVLTGMSDRGYTVGGFTSNSVQE
jgi:hypothetical protein